MFVRATLLDDSSFQVYFRSKQETASTCFKEDDYSMVLGVRSIPVKDPDQQSALVHNGQNFYFLNFI